jgi:DNA-binding SARP family transcriptional activator
MEFRILGPLQVSDGRVPVAVAGGKQRMLLALLLAQRGRRVPRAVLTEALWPDRALGDSVHAMDLHVSRLRKAIGPHRLVTEDGGYRLELSDAVVDADRFGELVADARERPALEAARLLRVRCSSMTTCDGAWRRSSGSDRASAYAACTRRSCGRTGRSNRVRSHRLRTA